MDEILRSADWTASTVLAPIVIWVLLSGFDELFLCLVFIWQRMCSRPPAVRLRPPERPIAILVPLWQEDMVIGRMIEHNLKAIRYRDYRIFLGVYPNDYDTVLAARELEQRSSRVYACLCPHDGPTSKADCLNWIFQRVLLWEARHGVRFDAIVTHDAEDLIHPESLALINRHIGVYDMVQIPVLPLPTPFTNFTHGVYCDEFAEYQLKDVAARPFLRSFLPSNGVGTGYSRDAIEKLAEAHTNRVFEPRCLTEDYENGIRLHRLGCRQIFLTPTFCPNPVATREYFPQGFRQAVRQRTRWVTGIALQSWQRYGWGRTLAEHYWFWRDRKGLVGNPAGLVANLVFLYGLARWCAGRYTGEEWPLATLVPPHPLDDLLPVTLALPLISMAFRAWAVSRIYGWLMAAGVPLRAVWANCINSVATVAAVLRWVRALILHEPLVWVKTEHCYPSAASLKPPAGFASPAGLLSRKAHAGD